MPPAAHPRLAVQPVLPCRHTLQRPPASAHSRAGRQPPNIAGADTTAGRRITTRHPRRTAEVLQQLPADRVKNPASGDFQHHQRPSKSYSTSCRPRTAVSCTFPASSGRNSAHGPFGQRSVEVSQRIRRAGGDFAIEPLRGRPRHFQGPVRTMGVARHLTVDINHQFRDVAGVRHHHANLHRPGKIFSALAVKNTLPGSASPAETASDRPAMSCCLRSVCSHGSRWRCPPAAGQLFAQKASSTPPLAKMQLKSSALTSCGLSANG